MTMCDRPLDFDGWREAISQAFVPLDATPLTPGFGSFEGGLHSRSLGDLQLSEVLGSSAHVRRSPRTIRRSDPGVIKVALQMAGTSTVTQYERQAALGPGDLAVYDTSERYDLSFAGTFDMLVAVLPRESLRISDSELRHATARAISTTSGVGALLRPMLIALRASSPDDSGSVGQTLVTDAVADLVSAALRAGSPDDSLGAGETILLSARAYIDARLGDMTLTPSAVAAHHHVSLRYLQKLFAHDGHSVAGFIRQRRLERCRRDLADPAQSHRGVGSICAANGLVDAAHFSRLFKNAYGMSPRQYRDNHLSVH